MSITRTLIPALLLTAAAASAARASTEYKIQLLGLSTSSTNTVSTFNTAGDITGFTGPSNAWLYNHSTHAITLIQSSAQTITAMDNSGDVTGITNNLFAWYYNNSNATTSIIGYNDGAHTSASVFFINSSGQVAGDSSRPATSSNDAWIYDKNTNTTTPIGPTGSPYTHGTNPLTAMNALGQIIGNSSEYSGNTATFADPWLYDPTAVQPTTLLTLPNSVSLPAGYFHTFNPQCLDSSALNDAGDIVGVAANNRNIGSATSNQPFLYNPRSQSVYLMGLSGGIYSGSDGRTQATNFFLSPTGQVAGISGVYSGTSAVGTDAWFFDKTTNTNTPIGLSTGNFAGINNARTNSPIAMSTSGQFVVGQNQSGGNTSYWEYDNSSHQTILISFNTAPYLNSTNHSSASFVAMNSSGKSLGLSFVYNGAASIAGSDTWLYNPATTSSLKIGLLDPTHTNNLSAQRNIPGFINDAGDVIGTSLRYNGGSTSFGPDGWYFNPADNSTTPLNFSTSSTGNASIVFKSLAPDGTALGSYEKYNGSTDLGRYAFTYNPLTGPTDLNLSVANLSDAGWKQLEFVSTQLTSNQLIGTGHLTISQTTENTFLLTPLIPDDADMSGAVDILDLQALANHWQQSGASWTQGDFNNSGNVDILDLQILANHWQLGTTSGSGSSQSFNDALALFPTPTPEPASLTLLTFATLPLLTPRRKRP